jgi:hypothetical protein
MPQASAITINDGATTPVAHTFTPIGKDEKGVMWFEQTTPTATSPLGAKRIGYRQTRVLDSKKQLTGMSKVVVTLNVPTLETLANNSAGIVPPPTLAYAEAVRLEFDLAERSTKQERKDTRVLLANFLAHAMAVANIDDLQPTYS